MKKRYEYECLYDFLGNYRLVKLGMFELYLEFLFFMLYRLFRDNWNDIRFVVDICCFDLSCIDFLIIEFYFFFGELF